MARNLRFPILTALLMLIALLASLALATPYLINTRLVKTQISKQISTWMGLPVTVQGEPIVTVFPYLTIKLKDLEIASKLGSDQPPLVSMQVLRAEMYWLPLLLGKFEVRRFGLEEPIFQLVRNSDGQTSWDMTDGSLVSSDNADGSLELSDISLGNFTILNGKATYIDEMRGLERAGCKY